VEKYNIEVGESRIGDLVEEPSDSAVPAECESRTSHLRIIIRENREKYT